MRATAMLALALGRIHGYQDLGGLRVGHYRDPAVERSLYALAGGVGAKFVPLDDDSELLTSLAAADVDAVLSDSTFVRWWLRAHPGLRVVGEPLNHLGYHLGVRREDPQLLRRLDAAIADLLGSSEIAQIRARWEGTGR